MERMEYKYFSWTHLANATLVAKRISGPDLDDRRHGPDGWFSCGWLRFVGWRLPWLAWALARTMTVNMNLDQGTY